MLVKIAVEVTGTTPLLCNQFTDASQMDASSGSSLSTKKDRGTPREQAENAVYKDPNGKPIIPSPNLLRCIIDAGKFFKSGKSKITTLKSSLLSACVDLGEMYYFIAHKDPWTVDTRPVRIPATGGRILRHRACFNDWKLKFEVGLDTDIISPKLFREIIDRAGRQIGLGDFRPDCKGPFGKFVVTSWVEKG